MNLIGLDVNATRILALGGPEGAPPRPLPLSDDSDDMPTAVSMQGRQLEIGKPALAMVREWPHLVCHDFLASIGKPKTWSAGRHKLDAAKALTAIGEKIKPHTSYAKSGAAVFPAYLSHPQGAQTLGILQKLRLPLIGSVTAPLAAGLAAHHQKRWNGRAFLIDVDDHALTWSILKLESDQLHADKARSLPTLGLHAWKLCLLDAISERCVRHSRRDPRDSGSAEQLLYDQLGDVFVAARKEQLVEVVVRTTTWCQNLFLQPEQVYDFCAPRAEEVAEEISLALMDLTPEPLGAIWLTDSASQLPGLVPMLSEIVGENVPVASLPFEAVARTAHEIAGRMYHGDLPHAHLDVAIALPRHRPAVSSGSFLKIPTFGPEQ